MQKPTKARNNALFESLEARRLLAGPLGVASDGRHLTDATGRPFFLVGDSGWSIIVEGSVEDARDYLDDRVRRGFNTVIMMLTDNRFYGGPFNANGHVPFEPLWDFTRPSEAYFAHADAILSEARKRGLRVLLAPAYLGFDGAGDGIYHELIAAGVEGAGAFGRYLGQRYAGFDNIIWMMGGDRTVDAALPMVNALAQGIRQFMPRAHFTAHSRPDTRPTANDYNQSWLTLGNTYTYLPTHVLSREEYLANTGKPFFHLESWYEGGGFGTPQYARNFSYWSVLGGSFGAFMGNHQVWPFASWSNWRGNLNSPAARDMRVMKDVVGARRWTDFVPDYQHRFVIEGYGSWHDYVPAAITPDGAQAIVYLPGNRADAFAPPPRQQGMRVVLDASRLARPARASWIDPTTGRLTAALPEPIANRGTRAFTAPGLNGAGDTDWLLLLETDITPPQVTQLRFNVDQRQAITVQLSEDVYTGLDPALLTLTSTTAGTTQRSVELVTSYDRTGRRWTIRPARTLPDGNYRLRIPAAAIRDGATLGLASDATLDFHVLAGDANRDRRVDHADVPILVRHYGQFGRTFTQGDFNYDGRVNFADLLILARNYGLALPSNTGSGNARRRGQADLLG